MYSTVKKVSIAVIISANIFNDIFIEVLLQALSLKHLLLNTFKEFERLKAQNCRPAY